MTLTPVPDGWIGTVVTHLVQDAPPPTPPASELRLERWREPAPDAFRALFREVGGPWLWYSRLLKSDAELSAILSDPETIVLRARHGRDVVGFSELFTGKPDTPEITFLGLAPDQLGRGQGRWLLAETCRAAWAVPGAKAVRVNTCTLDHPAALPNYLRGAFRVTGRSMETLPDPRLSGVLPAHLAPHAPVVSPDSCR